MFVLYNSYFYNDFVTWLELSGIENIALYAGFACFSLPRNTGILQADIESTCGGGGISSSFRGTSQVWAHISENKRKIDDVSPGNTRLICQ